MDWLDNVYKLCVAAFMISQVALNRAFRKRLNMQGECERRKQLPELEDERDHCGSSADCGDDGHEGVEGK